jgi:predicted DNA-binding protein
MKRMHIHLAEQQIERLERMSKQTGLTVAELIRRAIDAYSVGWDLGGKMADSAEGE